MRFRDVVHRLETALGQPLPGAAAQSLMAPRPRRQWPGARDAARARSAAGLLLFVPIDDIAHIVLTVRAETVRHAGQVSLPGGGVEPGETYEQAALREAHEEIGLSRDGVRVRGALTPLDIPISGFRLHPVIATVDTRPALEASDGEVSRILEVAVADLTNASSLIETERTRDGHTLMVPAFHVAGVEIWGATAMILAECLVLLGWTRS